MRAQAEPLPLVSGIDVQLHRIVALLRARARDTAQTDDDAAWLDRPATTC
jgi:hypothetical protein